MQGGHHTIEHTGTYSHANNEHVEQQQAGNNNKQQARTTVPAGSHHL